MSDIVRMREEIQGIQKQLAAQQDLLTSLRKEFIGARYFQRVCTNNDRYFDIDTNVATTTTIDFPSIVGFPCRTLTVLSVGGGSLQIAINGGRFIAVNKNDSFADEIINRIDVNTSTQAAGTATLRCQFLNEAVR